MKWWISFVVGLVWRSKSHRVYNCNSKQGYAQAKQRVTHRQNKGLRTEKGGYAQEKKRLRAGKTNGYAQANREKYIIIPLQMHYTNFLFLCEAVEEVEENIYTYIGMLKTQLAMSVIKGCQNIPFLIFFLRYLCFRLLSANKETVNTVVVCYYISVYDWSTSPSSSF